jgi:hypothetical protein
LITRRIAANIAKLPVLLRKPRASSAMTSTPDISLHCAKWRHVPTNETALAVERCAPGGA